jgi:hypothetical protein
MAPCTPNDEGELLPSPPTATSRWLPHPLTKAPRSDLGFSSETHQPVLCDLYTFTECRGSSRLTGRRRIEGIPQGFPPMTSLLDKAMGWIDA